MQNQLNPLQLQALQNFKASVVLLERDNNDAACLRFLRARNYDVVKSVEMYNNYKQWRQVNNVDNILNERPEVEPSKWPRSFHGVDRQGRPIIIERVGCVDVKHLMEKDKVDLNRLLRGYIRTQEHLCALHDEYSRREGRLIENSITILDLDGFGLHKHLNSQSREYFGSLANIGQNYYPERMGRMLVINAPRAFPMAWSFVKALLDPNTQDKIEVISSSQLGKRLSEMIDPQYIPKYMGGLCDCDRKGCFSGTCQRAPMMNQMPVVQQQYPQMQQMVPQMQMPVLQQQYPQMQQMAQMQMPQMQQMVPQQMQKQPLSPSLTSQGVQVIS